MCFTVIETVSYYIGYLGHTHMCTLDASKAFDRVNLVLLFIKLQPLSTVHTFHSLYLF